MGKFSYWFSLIKVLWKIIWFLGDTILICEWTCLRCHKEDNRVTLPIVTCKTNPTRTTFGGAPQVWQVPNFWIHLLQWFKTMARKSESWMSESSALGTKPPAVTIITYCIWLYFNIWMIRAPTCGSHDKNLHTFLLIFHYFHT